MKGYAPVNGKLRDHFDLKADNKVIGGEKVICFHCEKVFVFSGSYTSMTYQQQQH